VNEAGLILRLARLVVAEQLAGQRRKDRDMTFPVNSPRGIDRTLVRENGLAVDDSHDETVNPHRRDIRPQDVFSPTPNILGVLNLAQTGKDLSNAVQNQIPKDKGYDAVRNLSQYLIETKGGGGAKPVV
jgi:hypothetical protein